MISGKKLRELRLLRNLTQKELAIKSRLSDAAIRNYELGNRSPTKEQLDTIAMALCCDPSAITDHSIINNLDFYQILFELESTLKLRPYIEESGLSTLMSSNPEFHDFLIEWDEMRKKHYDNQITEEEFRDWKLSYPKKSRFMRR